MLFSDKKECGMKKRWIIIIAVVILLASYIVYQYFNPNSNRVIGDLIIAERQPSAGTAANDRSVTEHELGMDVPVYVQAFRNISVPSPQSFPANTSTPLNNKTLISSQKNPSAGSLVSSQPMIVRTAGLDMAVNDIAASMAQITQLAYDNNGFVVSANKTSSDKSISGVIGIRIPSAQFESVMSSLRALAVKVTSENISASDVSQEYTDLSAKLRNSVTVLAQFTQIMQKADKIEDVLAVQKQLTDTQQDIEVTKGRMQYLEQTSAMSLITVNLQQSTLIVTLSAGTSYARTNDKIGFAVNIQGGIGPFSYQWDFGDGARSVEAEPWHKYDAAGNYTVNVTVTDDKGNKSVDTRSDYINILPGWSPRDILDGAWRGMISLFRFLYVVFVWLLMFSPLIIVIGLIWYFTRRSLKRRKTKVA
jgi:hypothetical protein